MQVVGRGASNESYGALGVDYLLCVRGWRCVGAAVAAVGRGADYSGPAVTGATLAAAAATAEFASAAAAAGASAAAAPPS